MSNELACKPTKVKTFEIFITKKVCFQKPKPCPEWECDPCLPCEEPCADPWSGLTDCDETSKAWLVTCDDSQGQFHVVG